MTGRERGHPKTRRRCAPGQSSATTELALNAGADPALVGTFLRSLELPDPKEELDRERRRHRYRGNAQQIEEADAGNAP
jgi:hypothetical protein